MKKEHGSGNGTEIVYLVEARCTYTTPEVVNGQIFDVRWRVVHFNTDQPMGVPNDVFNRDARSRFLSYGAAVTLANWFLTGTRSCCVEARLVQIKYEYRFTTEEVGVGLPLSHTYRERNDGFRERGEEERTDDAVAGTD